MKVPLFCGNMKDFPPVMTSPPGDEWKFCEKSLTALSSSLSPAHCDRYSPTICWFDSCRAPALIVCISGAMKEPLEIDLDMQIIMIYAHFQWSKDGYLRHSIVTVVQGDCHKCIDNISVSPMCTRHIFLPMRIYISKIITMNNENSNEFLAYNMLILVITTPNHNCLFKAMTI